MRTTVDVHNYLVGRDIPHELFSVRGRLRSPDQIASVLDLPVTHVGRVAVFETDTGPVLAVVSSNRNPDPERVREAVGAASIKEGGTSAARASQLTEYLHDAIPPVGLPDGFTVVADADLADEEILYFAAGDAAAILKIRARDLIRAANAVVAPISTEG